MKFHMIESGRLLFRLPLEADIHAIEAVVSSSAGHLSSWLSNDDIPIATEKWTTAQTINALQGRVYFFLGFRKQLDFGNPQDSPIACGCILKLKNGKLPSYSVAYWTVAQFQNQGFATEALVAITTFAFSVLNARRVSTGHAAPNVASQRVIEKAGFKRESVVALGYEMPNGGEFLDGVVYGTTNKVDLREQPLKFWEIDVGSLISKELHALAIV